MSSYHFLRNVTLRVTLFCHGECEVVDALERFVDDHFFEHLAMQTLANIFVQIAIIVAIKFCRGDKVLS